MHRLKEMKDCLVSCVQAQLSDIQNADTHELGEAIDMIKDLEQAMYYCSIVKAMEKQEEEEKFYEKLAQHRDMDKNMGRMYYTERERILPKEFRNRRIPDYVREDEMKDVSYTEREVPFNLHDSREGRSPMSRRNYMEAKELHKDKNEKIKELEKYMQELSQDIIEMIEDASPEERQMLEKKMTHLTSKVAQLNV